MNGLLIESLMNLIKIGIRNKARQKRTITFGIISESLLIFGVMTTVIKIALITSSCITRLSSLTFTRLPYFIWLD